MNRRDTLTPIAIIHDSPHGSAMISRYTPPQMPEETCWLMRESDATIHHLAAANRFEVRSATFIDDLIQLPLVMLSLSTTHHTRRYESWLDPFDHDLGGHAALRNLTIQPNLNCFVYGDHPDTLPLHIQILNPLQSFARHTLTASASMPHIWSAAEFTEARNRIRHHCSSLELLWNKIQHDDRIWLSPPLTQERPL